MKLKNAKVALLAAKLVTFGSLTEGANGAIIFTASANDLEINITSPIELYFGVDGISPTFTLVLEDVYNTSQAQQFFALSTSTASVTVFGEASSLINESAVGLNGGDVVDTDLLIGWSFDSVKRFNPANTITVNAGNYVIKDFLLTSSLPDSSPDTVFVIQYESATTYTNTATVMTVPEPSSVLLIGLGSLGFVLRRSRNR